MPQLSAEIALWVVTAGLPVVIGLQLRYSTMLKRVFERHEDPDAHGFGTDGLKARQEELIRQQQDTNHCLRELIHYMRYVAKHQNGGAEPPPYVGGPQ